MLCWIPVSDMTEISINLIGEGCDETITLDSMIPRGPDIWYYIAVAVITASSKAFCRSELSSASSLKF